MNIKVLGGMVVLLLLAGCEAPPGPYLFRPNTTVSTKDNDLFQCHLAAAQQVPANTQIGTTPVYSTPITTSCYGYSCTTSGGQVYGGNTYSYDGNASLRSEYGDRCMASKGYSSTVLPSCPANLAVPVELRQMLSGKLRSPETGSCRLPITERTSNLIYANEMK